jgi:hypothetical protein
VCASHGRSLHTERGSPPPLRLARPAPDGRPGAVTFYVEVDDPAAYLKKVGELGGKTIVPPTELPQFGLMFAFFSDPEGHVVGLSKAAVQPRADDLQPGVVLPQVDCDVEHLTVGSCSGGSPTLAWGSVAACEQGRSLSSFGSCFLRASAETVDNTGNMAGAHIAPSSSECYSAARHPS